MKVVILAGGKGSRLSEYTEFVPKPMVAVGGRPLLWHIMTSFSGYGHTEFVIATGHKASVIKDYFLNYRSLNSDFTVDLASNALEIHAANVPDWKVTIVDTGEETMTGGRVKRLAPFIDNSPFLLTYGDGLSNVDITKLIDFHMSHGKLVTVTAVRPAARFGEIQLSGDTVTIFQEKPQTAQGLINGGYFVVEPNFLDFIDSDESVLEREPLERVVAAGQLAAFVHDGFWQCMDTKRDLDYLNQLALMDQVPWMK